MKSVAWAVAVVLDLHTGVYGTIAYVCVAEAMALMGVLLTTRIPQHRISWVIAIAALWWGISGLANAHAVEALVEDPGSLPAGVAAAWFDGWAWLPCLALFLCALLVLMPDGRLASRRWWPAPASMAILLEIADDGHGMKERRVGVGMQTMRERATELGGTCQITSTPGARASVAARLPALASGVEAG